MKHYSKVNYFPNLVKDMSTNAVLSINHNNFEEFKNKKLIQQRLENLSDEYKILKNDISEIKSQMTKILDLILNK